MHTSFTQQWLCPVQYDARLTMPKPLHSPVTCCQVPCLSCHVLLCVSVQRPSCHASKESLCCQVRLQPASSTCSTRHAGPCGFSPWKATHPHDDANSEQSLQPYSTHRASPERCPQQTQPAWFAALAMPLKSQVSTLGNLQCHTKGKDNTTPLGVMKSQASYWAAQAGHSVCCIALMSASQCKMVASVA